VDERPGAIFHTGPFPGITTKPFASIAASVSCLGSPDKFVPALDFHSQHAKRAFASDYPWREAGPRAKEFDFDPLRFEPVRQAA
jgi:hypothetical protein